MLGEILDDRKVFEDAGQPIKNGQQQTHGNGDRNEGVFHKVHDVGFYDERVGSAHQLHAFNKKAVGENAEAGCTLNEGDGNQYRNHRGGAKDELQSLNVGRHIFYPISLINDILHLRHGTQMFGFTVDELNVGEFRFGVKF